jgi:eukaryotic-like serine/threonine-protein kinase
MSRSLQKGELVASRYALDRPLARGGMGSLWVARHVELDVEVAIKFSVMERGPAHDLRFRREARAAARLKSPHIVHVFDYGFDGGEPYIAMELLEGESLRELMEREGRLPLPRAAALVAEIAKGLGVAHEAGIVHRDLKPSNLFLSRSGNEQMVKILDFGIAKASAEAGGEASDSAQTLGGDATRAGAIVGSPAYMSPEQARGELVDARSDLWSLAVVTFRMLTGVEPFTGASAAETLDRISSAPLPRVAAELEAFFERGLARVREERFQSAQELAGALAALAARHPDARAAAVVASGTSDARIGRTAETRPIEPALPRRSRRAAAGALAVFAGATLGAYVWAKRDPPAAPSAGTTASPPSSAPFRAAIEPASLAAPALESAAGAKPARPPFRKPIARRGPEPETPPNAGAAGEPEQLDPVFGLKP